MNLAGPWSGMDSASLLERVGASPLGRTTWGLAIFCALLAYGKVTSGDVADDSNQEQGMSSHWAQLEAILVKTRLSKKKGAR